MTMAESGQKAVPRSRMPLRLDSSAISGGLVEASPVRSPTQSSSGHSYINTPSTSIPSTPVLSARPTSPDEYQPLSPGFSNGFLTALAAQERRVLELKEELQKAEQDLEKLKKQWAAQEATKKRHQTRQSEKMKPLRANRPEMSPIVEHGTPQAGRTLERRTTLSSTARPTQRKVFSGSRHTRTLSLLTTGSRKEIKEEASPKPVETRPRGSLDRNLPRLSPIRPNTDLAERGDAGETEPKVEKDLIFETGKQIVGDFRQGFWTFVEDLKQVTVGDDILSASKSRASPQTRSGAEKKPKNKTPGSVPVKAKVLDGSSSTSERVSQDSMSEAPELSECGSKETELSSPSAIEHSSQCNDSDDEPWDDWGTPQTKCAESELKVKSKKGLRSPKLVLPPRGDSLAQPVAGLTKNIPWPALSSISPSRLSKTASDLMSEWEKSLASPTNTNSVLPVDEKGT